MSRGSGLEASDMNDKDILASTRQLTRGDGAFKFKITLTDGHTIESEFIKPDDKQVAIQRWLDVVKETAVARANEKVEETKARLRRQKAEENAAAEAANAAALGLIVPAGTAGSAVTTPVVSAVLPVAATMPPDSPASSSPLTPIALVQQQLAAAEAVLQAKMVEYQQAFTAVQQWKAMMQAMQAMELPQQPGVIQIAKSLHDGEV